MLPMKLRAADTNLIYFHEVNKDSHFAAWSVLFGKDKSPCHLMYGVTSLQLGVPVDLRHID
jgi:hypothetical protein